ncbi:MAG: TatD family hydrolase, partial [Chloroflexota bacterium]
MLVDTHCHLNFESFDQDRPLVIERARQAGVLRILNPAIDLATSRAAAALAGSLPEVYAAVGVHPNDAHTWQAAALPELRRLAAQPKVVAIGEIGLDDYWKTVPPAVQQQAFQDQLTLAGELDLPVVVHIRNDPAAGSQTTQTALGMLGEWQRARRSDRPGVLHSYSDSPELALQAVELGFRIGVTGPVTFKKAELLRQVVTRLPLEALLIETDAPFLTPHP